MRRGLKGRFRPALMVQLGSIVGHVASCPPTLLELAPLVSFTRLRLLVGAAGVIVLVWLGVSACVGCRGHLEKKN